MQTFAIALEQAVSDGVPAAGAGNIEEPGAIDRYTLNLAAPAQVCFEELGGPCGLQWTCVNSAAATVFANQSICTVSPGGFMLPAGANLITVSGAADGVGAYSIIVNTGEPADVTRDCHVNVNDLLTVITAWGACPIPADCPADTDGNGQVNVNDLLAVIVNWG